MKTDYCTPKLCPQEPIEVFQLTFIIKLVKDVIS